MSFVCIKYCIKSAAKLISFCFHSVSFFSWESILIFYCKELQWLILYVLSYGLCQNCLTLMVPIHERRQRGPPIWKSGFIASETKMAAGNIKEVLCGSLTFYITYFSWNICLLYCIFRLNESAFVSYKLFYWAQLITMEFIKAN